MFRLNVLRNFANLGNIRYNIYYTSKKNICEKLTNYEQSSVIRCYTSGQLARKPLYPTTINYPIRTTIFDNKFQSSLVQLTKATTPIAIQSREASTSGDHVRLWQIERIISAALIPLLPACFLLDSAVLESLLAVSVVMHTHWGLEAIVVDYARPAVVGNVIPKVTHMLLNIISAVTLAGLLVLIYNGPGISKSIKKGWAIGKEEKH